MHILQYFVFDETGDNILEAAAIPCSSEQELKETARTMVENYHSSPEMQGLGLVLNDNTNAKVLYNSKEEN